MFAPTAAYLYDVSAFLADWLVDLDLEQQHADGRVPFVVPDVLKRMPPPPGLPPVDTAAVWSDAAVWVPWALYEAYGDPAVLERQYHSMSAHVRRVASKVSRRRRLGPGVPVRRLARPDAPPDQPWAAKADPGVVATACVFRSARIVARVAESWAEDDAEFTRTGRADPRAFNARVRRRDGTVRSDCTTAYTLAIVFDLFDPRSTLAGDRLADSGRRAATGSRPGSPARRTSAKRWPGPATSTTRTHCCCRRSARRGSTR